MSEDILFSNSKTNPYVKIKMNTLKGEKYVDFHGYLYGCLKTMIYRKDHKKHNFIILTGDWGEGKSTLAFSLASLWEYLLGKQFGWDNIFWTPDKFIELTNKEDNKEEVLLWDEAILGATGKNMANTSQGFLITASIGTKRFKKHLYILLINRVEKFSKDIYQLSNLWINVKSYYGVKRGYFDAYVNNEKKDKLLYWFKDMRKSNFPAKTNLKFFVEPDCRGRFDDYTGLFLDEEEYDKKKLEETNLFEKKENSESVKQKFSKEQLEVIRGLCMFLSENKLKKAYIERFGGNYKLIERLEKNVEGQLGI